MFVCSYPYATHPKYHAQCFAPCYAPHALRVPFSLFTFEKGGNAKKEKDVVEESSCL